MAPLAFARAANVATPTLDIVLPLAAHKAMAKGLYRPFRPHRIRERAKCSRIFYKLLVRQGNCTKPRGAPGDQNRRRCPPRFGPSSRPTRSPTLSPRCARARSASARTFELAGSGIAHIGARPPLHPRQPAPVRDPRLRGARADQADRPRDLASRTTSTSSTRSARALYAGEIDPVRVEKRYMRKDGAVGLGGLQHGGRARRGAASRTTRSRCSTTSPRASAPRRRCAESEERFRRTFELADCGLAHVGLDGRFMRVNRRMCEILGYSEAELRGLHGEGHLASRRPRPHRRGRAHALFAARSSRRASRSATCARTAR